MNIQFFKGDFEHCNDLANEVNSFVAVMLSNETKFIKVNCNGDEILVAVGYDAEKKVSMEEWNSINDSNNEWYE